MSASGKLLIAILAGMLVVLAVAAVPYGRTAAFLLDLAGVEDGIRAWIPVEPLPVTWTDVPVPTRHGAMDARIYEPATPAPPTVVVFPGVHGGGVDAPRLTRLCERLSASGLRVACAPLPDLREFRITGRSTDMMEDATAWIAATFSPERRVALVGVSFAGGLALIAAGRAPLDGRLSAVISIGGHGALARTLQFLTTGKLPDGSRRQPHDYALAVVALTIADRLVPGEQVDAFSEAVRTFLEASLDGRAGTPEGMAMLEALETRLEALPEPTRSLAAAVVARDVDVVGAALRPHLAEFARDPALSPALAPRPQVPVFLLHGTTDNVIPSSETPLTASDLEAHGNDRVRWLLTPLLTHAHLMDSAGPTELWQLLDFWHDVRAAVE